MAVAGGTPPPLHITIAPIPPKASKKKPGLNEFYAKYPGVAQWKVLIGQWSRQYGVSPLDVAAIIQHETGGSNTPPQGVAAITSNPPGGPVAVQAFLRTSGTGAVLNPTDVSQSIAFLAWTESKSQYNGNVEAFYQNVWNPNYKPPPGGTSPKDPSPGQLASPYQGGTPIPPATAQQRAAGTNNRQSVQLATPYSLDKLKYLYRPDLIAAFRQAQYTPTQAANLADQILKQAFAAKYPPGEEGIYINQLLKTDVANVKANLKVGEIRSRYETEMMVRANAAGYYGADARKLVARAILQTATASSELLPNQVGSFLTEQFQLAAGLLSNQLKATQKLQAAELSQQKQFYREFSPTFLAYGGRTPTISEIQNIIDTGMSKYQVALNMMKSPAFTKSPIYLQNIARYTAYYQAVFGPGAKLSKEALGYAIVHSLDETAFKNMLQHDQLPDQAKYTTSEEYKGLYATYQSAYSNIYGLPDEVGRDMIEQAIKKGWTADQWTQYLRKQPEYTSSGEYQARAMDLASRMGLIQAPQQTLVSPVAHPTEAMTDELQGQPQGNPTPPQVSPVPVGEPKNQPPFTRPVGR